MQTAENGIEDVDIDVVCCFFDYVHHLRVCCLCQKRKETVRGLASSYRFAVFYWWYVDGLEFCWNHALVYVFGCSATDALYFVVILLLIYVKRNESVFHRFAGLSCGLWTTVWQTSENKKTRYYFMHRNRFRKLDSTSLQACIFQGGSDSSRRHGKLSLLFKPEFARRSRHITTFIYLLLRPRL